MVVPWNHQRVGFQQGNSTMTAIEGRQVDCADCEYHKCTIDVLEQTRREAAVTTVRMGLAIELLRRVRAWTPDENPHAQELLADVSTFLALPGCTPSGGVEL